MTKAENAQTLQEAAAQFRWTAVIGGFFVIQASIWGVAIVLTNNDSSHAIVADYDQKGQTWNETAAERQASEKLGWTASIQVVHAEDLRGFHTVRVRLLDNRQQPIDTAEVELSLLHRAHAARAETLIVKQESSGEYAVATRMTYDGLWRFRLRVQRGADVFLHEETQQLTGFSKLRPGR